MEEIQLTVFRNIAFPDGPVGDTGQGSLPALDFVAQDDFQLIGHIGAQFHHLEVIQRNA